MNMLSAKKVRVHGMKSSRWTTKDKIIQYKGIINLFTRDKKILSSDAVVTRKKIMREIKQMNHDIEQSRSILDNAIQGDRQMLRNTLQDHRDLQLAFQNVHPLVVVEQIHQENFKKRKLFDRLAYSMKMKSDKLISLKLELAELEDKAKYEGVDPYPVEIESKIVTGKVQDAILKKEAALSVRNTYEKILKILKKDAVFFDVVLETLKIDGFLQGRCMVRTTELGQLATEYLDDRKQEFAQLAKAVRRDMKIREKTLKTVRREADDLYITMTALIRKDDDVNTGRVIIPFTDSDLALQQNVQELEDVMSFLLSVCFETDYERIYPSLIEQDAETKRLKNILKTATKNRDNLLNKRDHAKLMYDHLLYTMNETTNEYKKEKAQLLQEKEERLKQKSDTKEIDLHQCKLLVHVRKSIHQLALKCSVIMLPGQKQSPVERKIKIDPRAGELHAAFIAPPVFQEDCTEILKNLEKKVNLLMNRALASLDQDTLDEANKFFYNCTKDTCSMIPILDDEEEDDFIGAIEIDDPSVPSYNEVKLKSAEMVEACTVDEDSIPLIPQKK